MNATFLPASDLHSVEGAWLEPLPNGAIRALPGNQGFVLYGPYMRAADGVYRIAARAQVLDSEGQSYFDVCIHDRIYATRRYRAGCEVFVRLADAHRLEFRFKAGGEGFVVEGVELEPLLLDEQRASVEQVTALTERLLAAQGEPDAIFHLLDRLEALGDVQGAEALRRRFVEGAGRPLARVRAILLELNTPDRRELADSGSPIPRAQIADALAGRRFSSFDAYHLSPEDKLQLLERGYHPDFIHATRLNRYAAEPPRRWRERPGALRNPSGSIPAMPLFNQRAERELSFQAELGARGEMSAYCPVSGRRVTSNHAFVQLFCNIPFLFYRFEGVEVFYVCTGYHANSRAALYMPRTETIVDIRDPGLRWHSQAEVIRAFLLNLVDFREDVLAYLGGPTSLAVVTGSDNLGHFIWSDVSGLHYAAESGLLDRVTEVIELERSYLPVQWVFPELAHLPSTSFGQGEAAFAHCVRRALLPTRFTDAVISDALADRLRVAAEAHADPSAGPPSGSQRPLVWINLRAHNKVWISQADGYAQLLNAIREEFGGVSAFLDGWTDCAEIAAEIRRRTHPEVDVHNGLGIGIFDSLKWAFAIDSYVSAIGAGLVLVSWIANKPGVAHAERLHMDQMLWWRFVRDNAVQPSTPEISQIQDQGVGLYCDYEVDWRVLLDLLRPILARRFEPRTLSAGVDAGGPGR